MRKCDDCKIILDNDVVHCPKCGKDLSGSSSPARTAGSDVTSLLASANLHKIRAEWDEAIADCTDALRLDPRNPDIASLLGAIYEERGMFDEALVWYQMALELNPDSGPDQDRLARVAKATEAKRDRRDSESFSKFERRTKFWGIALGLIVVMIIVAAVVTTLIRNRSTQSASAKPTPTGQSQDYAPRMNRPSVAPQGPTAPPEATAKPTSTGGAPARTAGESYIRSELAAAQGVVETGANIDDVTADPRVGVANVTFTVPFRGVVNKDQIIRASVAVASKTFELNREVKFVTVRCMVQTGGAAGTQIAFIGDIARQTVEALPPTASNEQFTAAFTRPWWNPQMQGIGNRP